jgi:phosphoenolpyruvate carboxykinase (GTP)
MTSEKTAAAAGKVGELRRDPFAMLPFCGYNMGDYFAHWLKTGKKEGADLPKIFYVNWFRKDDQGKFLWPGYGENSRVLKWVFERVSGKGEAIKTSIGYLPKEGAIDVSGMDISEEEMAEILKVDDSQWKAELQGIRDHFNRFADRLPQEMWDELKALEERLG